LSQLAVEAKDAAAASAEIMNRQLSTNFFCASCEFTMEDITAREDEVARLLLGSEERVATLARLGIPALLTSSVDVVKRL